MFCLEPFRFFLLAKSGGSTDEGFRPERSIISPCLFSLILPYSCLCDSEVKLPSDNEREGRLQASHFVVLFCSVYILYFPSSQGTVCLDIEYVPPDGRDGQSEQQGDGDETDEDEDHDEDEDQEDKDEHDHDKGKETRRKKGKKRMPRRRIARKWSDKIKDFQVM